MSATKSTTEKPKRGRGRPSPFDNGYTATFPELGKKLAMLGAKDTEIADVFGVSESTLNLWKTKHPEFSESLRAGKLFADAEVASSLFHRATGYSHAEDDIRTVSIAGGGSEIVITPTTKHYPPDTTAAIFWLKNRQRHQWRDKVETGVTDSEGKDVDPFTPERIAEGARRIAFVLASAAKEPS